MNFIKGTIKQYETASYSAKAAFSVAFLDYLKLNSDNEAECRISPDSEQSAFFAGANASNFIFEESYAIMQASAEVKLKSKLHLSVEKVDFNVVDSYGISLPTNKIVYISNRPLFSTAIKPIVDDTDTTGGVEAGTFVLVSMKGIGLVLYWTSTSYENVMDSLLDVGTFYITADKEAVVNSVYIGTTPGTGSMSLELPDAAASKGSYITAIKKSGVVDFSVVPTGTDKLNGGSGIDLVSPWDSITVYSTGTEWVTTSLNIA